MTYNRSEILKAAWNAHRNISAESWAKMPVAWRAIRWANCLRNAWANAKIIVRKTAAAVMPEAERLAREILCLECKDRLTWEDFRELDNMRVQMDAAQRHEALPVAA